MPVRWSAPAARKLVDQMYKQVLGRPPEPQVAQGLVNYLQSGKTSARIQFTFMVKSEEFYDKRLRDRTPPEMTATLYKIILGRSLENQTELNNATDFLIALGWRVQADVMLNSEEYLNKFGDDVVPGVDAVPA